MKLLFFSGAGVVDNILPPDPQRKFNQEGYQQSFKNNLEFIQHSMQLKHVIYGVMDDF